MRNRQFFVRVATTKDFKQVLDRCIGKGYGNVHGLSMDSFPVHLNVIVIDDSSKQFGLANITCMAAAASQGKRAMDVGEFMCMIWR